MSARRARRAIFIALAAAIIAAYPVMAVTWGAVKPITASSTGWSTRGALIRFGSGGGAGIAYQDVGTEAYRVFYRRTTDSGVTWSSPIQLSRPAATLASAPNLASVSNRVDAVWLERTTAPEFRIGFRTSGNGGSSWSAPRMLTAAGSRAGYVRVARDTSTTTRLAVVWTDPVNGKVWLRRSVDGGASFVARQQVGVTTRQPWEGDPDYDAFPTISYVAGVLHVAWYSDHYTLRYRRSTNGGSAFSAPSTLASNGSGWFPHILAGGGKVLVGYTIWDGNDAWAAYRRSANKGVTWGQATALNPRSDFASYEPFFSYRAGTWRVAYERCLDGTCSQWADYHRESADGMAWSARTRVTPSSAPRPGLLGVVATSGGVIGAFVDFDSAADTSDVYARVGSLTSAAEEARGTLNLPVPQAPHIGTANKPSGRE